MNKIKKLLWVFVFSLTLFSCGSGGSPEGVAKDFLNALANKDFETAKELGTKSTKALLTMAEGMMEMVSEDEKKEPWGNLDDIEWGETKIDGNKATVYYTVEGKKDKIYLRKVDGDWKVDMKKDL